MSASPLEPDLHGSVLDSLDLGIALLDAHGMVVYANRALLRIIDRDALPDGGSLEVIAPRLGGEIDWSQAAQNAVERGRSVRLVRQNLADDAHFDVSLGPLGPGDPESKLALLAIADVSDAVRFERKMLRQARSQAIANLGDSVAHEIRNPLNSIHMNVQLLREGLAADSPETPRLDHLAGTVQKEIKRLDRVVRDFLQYSRSSGLSLSEGAPNLVLRAALDLLDAQIREKNISVELDLRSARPVRIDPDRLQRALYNILLNAVQVLQKGGTITCRSRDEPNRCLLEVTDDGPGLDLVKAPHLFDLFYTTKPGGTGLGLPIANRIIEEHGGRIAVSSKPGQGATFAIFLPYEGPPEPRQAGPTAVPDTGRTKEPS